MAVKILAADDSTTMRKVLETTFAGESVEIETVASGEAAVERASQSAPDLVIADASMAMDGYEVARTLKTSSGTENVAVIVLASQHHPYDAEQGRAAGVDDHILKPYDSQAMIDKARDVLSKPRARPAGGAAASPARPAPVKPPAPAAVPPAAIPRTSGAGRPAAPSPRATVAFGSASPPRPGVVAPPAGPGRPVLELADEEPIQSPPRAPTPAPAQAAVPSPPRPAIAKPAQPGKPAQPAKPAQPVAQPAKSAAAVATATATNGEMAARLAELGLTHEQVEGVLGLSREVIERVVWEVVPDLAEVIIREEIRRLTAE